MYACFAVSEAAALRALLGEPRMLGMTPDTVLVDLNAEETTPALASMLRREAAAWWRRAASSLGGGIRPVDADRAALLTAVAHAVPRGAVPAEPVYTRADGTRVTSFGPCLKKFAGGAAFGTREHEEGLESALRRAQGVADLERMDLDLDGNDGGGGVDVYGAAPNTLRFNQPLPMDTLRRMLDGTFTYSD